MIRPIQQMRRRIRSLETQQMLSRAGSLGRRSIPSFASPLPLPVVTSSVASFNGSNSTYARFSSTTGRFESSSLDAFDDFDDKTDPETAADDEKRRLAEERRAELLKKTGRGWTDPWDIDELLESNLDYDSLPDWAPNLVSRISQERVRIYNVNDSKIPTLVDLAALPLPPPPPPSPGLAGQTKAYALYRKRSQYKHVLQKVTLLAEPHIKSILALADWQDKQDAVDVLFEDIERTLKEKEIVLGKHPNFGLWVERALEEYLQSVTRREATLTESAVAVTTTKETLDTPHDTSTSAKSVLRRADESAVPVFMDCYNSVSGDTEELAVPNILVPLKPNAKGQSVGRMVEEWELSAHKSSKRIMLRQCTRQIAQAIVAAIGAPQGGGTTAVLPTDDSSSPTAPSIASTNASSSSNSLPTTTSTRIFVHGRQGVGKTAAIAAVVASARVSGCIVLYLPEGDQLHKNGFYIEPNARREGIFDLPILSKGVCQNMIDAHKDDLAQFKADTATMEAFFTDDQLSRFKGYSKDESMTLDTLLSYGADKVDMAPMCFAAAIDVLMRQDEKPFIMVLDEFNCFFQPGQYFHQDYDMDGIKPIPYTQISLFQPILNAMAVGPPVLDDSVLPVMMKRGAVIVGTTESHAVARSITDAVTARVELMQASNTTTAATNPSPEASSDEQAAIPSTHSILVPHLSAVEVEHMLANYEATGIGRLRLDRGETVMNDQEVVFLRMVSGGEAQKLMNACML